MSKFTDAVKKYAALITTSNRYKHIAGGFILGVFSDDIYTTILVGGTVGAALEYKDKSYGNVFDPIDLGCTVLGSLLGYGAKALVLSLF